jgi:hypothetical protein
MLLAADATTARYGGVAAGCLPLPVTSMSRHRFYRASYDDPTTKLSDGEWKQTKESNGRDQVWYDTSMAIYIASSKSHEPEPGKVKNKKRRRTRSAAGQGAQGEAPAVVAAAGATGEPAAAAAAPLEHMLAMQAALPAFTAAVALGRHMAHEASHEAAMYHQAAAMDLPLPLPAAAPAVPMPLDAPAAAVAVITAAAAAAATPLAAPAAVTPSSSSPTSKEAYQAEVQERQRRVAAKELLRAIVNGRPLPEIAALREDPSCRCQPLHTMVEKEVLVKGCDNQPSAPQGLCLSRTALHLAVTADLWCVRGLNHAGWVACLIVQVAVHCA